jgi:hypothetical protein
LLEKIERKAARSLSAEERSRVTTALRDLVDGMAPPRGQFVREISRISGVPEKRLWEFMPRVGGPANQDRNMIPKLEREMGRSLTREELDALRAADQQKKAATNTKGG